MVKIKLGDTIIITNPGASSIPERDRGYQGKVTRVFPREERGKVIMLTGPNTGTRWHFRFEGVDVLRGPW